MSLSVKVVGVTFDWNVFFSSQTTFSTLLKYWQVLQAQELPVDMALERQMRDSLQIFGCNAQHEVGGAAVGGEVIK